MDDGDPDFVPADEMVFIEMLQNACLDLLYQYGDKKIDHLGRLVGDLRGVSLTSDEEHGKW